MQETTYYDAKEFLAAVKAYEKAEQDANKIKEEVFSFAIGDLPLRSVTDEDLAIMQKSFSAWERVLEIARRPSPPTN